MKIALPIWKDRISPVFDASRELLIVEVKDNQETSRSEEALEETLVYRRVARLKELGVSELVCGAISRPLAAMLAASGVRVIPFVTGSVSEVLSAYLEGRLCGPRFLMPGCCGRRFRFRRGCIGRRRY